jgi:hypothetical protein
LAQRVIVENFDIHEKIMDVVLNASPVAARHTSVVHIKNMGSGRVQKKYIWAHKDMQPWGVPLPPQCENCGAFRPWGPRMKGKDKTTAKFRCQASMSEDLSCKQVLQIPKPKGELLQLFKDWMSMDWP